MQASVHRRTRARGAARANASDPASRRPSGTRCAAASCPSAPELLLLPCPFRPPWPVASPPAAAPRACDRACCFAWVHCNEMLFGTVSTHCCHAAHRCRSPFPTTGTPLPTIVENSERHSQQPSPESLDPSRMLSFVASHADDGDTLTGGQLASAASFGGEKLMRTPPVWPHCRVPCLQLLASDPIPSL